MKVAHAHRAGVAQFRPRARLLKLIGSELISDEIVAVTELVKNAHDADATCVTITFSGVTGAEGEIFIRDDGHGMDLDTLLTRWMQPAGSGKGRAGARFTAKGRRLLGEKGVGRFAADKLGANLELVSRPAGESSEVHALFDWDEFEADERLLDDVSSHWAVRAPEWMDAAGTALRISGLRVRWTERMFRRLSTRLSRLISPFGAGSGFRVMIESDEFPEYAGELAGGYLDVAPYRIDAEFDGADAVVLRINDGKQIRQAWPGEQSLRCGPVRVRIHAFDLETEALARIGPRAEVRGWLREWSGVSVYRDGFRVWPYGEPHDDWLRLDQRRVNNPTVKLSNNQIVGFVEIDSDRNPDLRDQTNREGLIHNDAFQDLQRFAHFVLQLLEAERQAIRHPGGKRKEGRKGVRGAAVDEATAATVTLERLAARVPEDVRDDILRAAGRLRTQLAAQELAHRKTLEGFVDLASVGQMLTVLGPQVESRVAEMRALTQELSRFLRHPKLNVLDVAHVAQSLDGLVTDLDGLAGQVTLTRPGQASTARRRGLDVAAELARVRAAFQPLLDAAGATLVIDAAPGAVLRTEMRPESFAAVIAALVRNSLEWAAEARALRISVVVREQGDLLELIYSDTGKGVLHSLEADLFRPRVSGRDGAAGMGLTLAHNVVTTHGGTLDLLVDRRRKGATFRIVLPRKRSRATSPA